jgi:glutaredoxin
VVVFSKDGCPYCQQVKELFASLGVEPTVSEDGDLKESVFEISSQRTVPQVFIGGKLLGDAEATMAANESGALFGLLSAAGVEADGAKAGLTPGQLLEARKAMVPDPYIEDSLAERGVFADLKDGELPSSFPNLYSFDAATGKFELGYMERNKSYAKRPDDKELRVRDQEAEVSERKQTLELTLPTKGCAFKLRMVQEVTERWGIKFVAYMEGTFLLVLNIDCMRVACS